MLIAAYDVSTGESSEGHVAYNVLQGLSKFYRVILVTRKNNKQRLKTDKEFRESCPGVRLIGFDLPKWASWWKRGPKFYQLYAYLWQLCWPQTVLPHARLRKELRLVHVLNFHNDSIPSSAWQLGPAMVWGPVNHNEHIPRWRRTFWPATVSGRHILAFVLRQLIWKFDPFLRRQVANSSVIVSAGPWVDRRLSITGKTGLIRRSQLGVDSQAFPLVPKVVSQASAGNIELICAGRLDWIKGVDLAIEAVAFLPPEYILKIVGTGPAEPRLRALAERLGLTSRVVFHPPVTRKLLAELYSCADLFVFPSAEVGGLVWVEALAVGLPVVAFDGESEIAHAARTLPGIQIVPTGQSRDEQIEGLARTIRTAASMPRNSPALRESVLQHYGWDRLASALLEAYTLAPGWPR